MRVVELNGGGSADLSTLRLAHRNPSPLPPGHLRVQVHAISLNYRDLLVARGQYGPRPEDATPLIVGSDAAGSVIEVGANVSGWRVGDRVVTAFFPAWQSGPYAMQHAASALGAGSVDGVLAEEIVLPDSAFVRLPDQISFEAASTLPCAGVTAWNALFETSVTNPGDSVLIVGTGGVGTFALQFAVAAGLRAIVITGSETKATKVRAMGAAATVNYRSDSAWGDAVAALSDGGVKLAVEAAGAGTLNQSIRSVAPGGSVSMVGVLTGLSASIDTIQLIVKRANVRGINVGSREDLTQVVQAVHLLDLQPMIDRVFALDDYRHAFDYLATGSHMGKVVIRI